MKNLQFLVAKKHLYTYTQIHYMFFSDKVIFIVDYANYVLQYQNIYQFFFIMTTVVLIISSMLNFALSCPN